MRIVWGMVAGLGMAGLLIAGAPAQAQTGSSGSSYGQSGRDQSTASPSSPSQGGTGSMGTGSESGSMGSGSMGSMSSSMRNEVTGKVTKFDKSKNELSLQLPVSDSTQVTKNGQPATLNDIKEGDQVRASFSGTGSQIKVNKIDVLSSGGAGSSSGSMGGSSSGTGSSSTGTGAGSPSGSSPSGSSGSSSRGY